MLENARTMNVRRLQQDIDRISAREIEFAKKLFEEIVPVKVEWNPAAFDKLQEFVPIRVELKDQKKETKPEVEVVEAEIHVEDVPKKMD